MTTRKALRISDGRVLFRVDLKLPSKKKKKKKQRHPAGGYYWGPDWPKGTPKQYQQYKPPIVNV